MIITTGNELAGCQVTEHLGVVRGIVVRAPGAGRSVVGGIRALAGGNIPEYVTVCEKARDEACEAMIQHARTLDADAVIAFRYDTAEFMQGLTEVLAYGTAVKVQKA